MVDFIHILGPSGSGTTTLGKAISEKYDMAHFDADDYFWYPTDPPYEKKRPIEKRQQLLFGDLINVESAVISGSLCSWGDIFISFFDLVIYLWVPAEIRIKRLIKRERKEFGDDVLPGGRMYENHKRFLEWAASYDTGGLDMRSKITHELWLKKLDCPVLRIKGNYSLEENLRLVSNKIKEL
ncbi:MAG: AAA family ATPase [Halanaerobiales bacterium]